MNPIRTSAPSCIVFSPDASQEVDVIEDT
jgi:hypothetical protein